MHIHGNFFLHNYISEALLIRCKLAANSTTALSKDVHSSDRLSKHWTILELTSARYWGIKERLMDSDALDLSNLTKLEAEVVFLAIGLSNIVASWAALVEFFHDVLAGEEDSILSPTKHDQLFFDDAVFSRSRKYFWAIDTLTQIDSLITDNIVQWAEYKEQHVDPMINILKFDYLSLAEEKHSNLIQKRDLFRKHLASFQLLRDGVRPSP